MPVQKCRLGHSLPREFYEVPALELANKLLGRLLVSRINDQFTSGLIVETEAYLSSNDPASHAARGKTPRTAVQWGPPGFSYVYLIYGMYHCLNIVSDREGSAGCVLLRAIEPIHGIETMQQRRPRAKTIVQLSNGPGKLTAALGVSRQHNALDLTQRILSICDYEDRRIFELRRSSRIGLTEGLDLPYRFYINGNPFVSK